MASQIQFRRGTAAEWAAANPVLAAGELGVELNTGLTKIGDGATSWTSLAYASLGNGDFATLLLSGQPVDPGAAPAGRMRLYSKAIAGRMLPRFVGPAGMESYIQPFLARNKIGYWCPPGNATTAPGVLGYTAHTAAGTATARNVATTNLFSRMRRLGYVSAATAGSLAGARVPVAQVTLADGAGAGGFFKVVRWGISDAVLQTVARTFVGVSSSVAAPTNVNPATLTNSIGMGHAEGASTMSLYYGGSTAQAPIDLGANFPANTTNTDAYELALFAPPSSTGLSWEVTRLNTGHVAAGTIANTNPGVTLPTSTTLLTYLQAWRSNNTAAAAVGLDIMSDYIETDY